jgi:hypothetical protein
MFWEYSRPWFEITQVLDHRAMPTISHQTINSAEIFFGLVVYSVKTIMGAGADLPLDVN